MIVGIAVLGSAAGLCSAADFGWNDVSAKVQPTGNVRADYFRSSKSFDDATNLIGATAQVKLLPVFNRWLEAKVEARGTSPDVGDQGFTGTLIEGFVAVRLAKLELRLGKQIVVWGRADGINPTDNLTPRDFAVMLPFEDDQRLGTPAARFDYYLSESHTLTLFTTPWFQPGKLPLPGFLSAIPRVEPPRRFSRSEVGVRLNRVGEGFDWSVSFYHGYNLLPSFRVPDGGRRTPTQRFDEINVFGADFARNFGRFGLRGEAAYIDTPDRRGVDPIARTPQFYWVMGVDRTYFDNLNVNVQFFQRQVVHYRTPDPRYFPVSFFNSILAGELNRTGYGVSCRISDKWLHDTLEAELFGVVNLNQGDAFARPSVTYELTDRWKATVGAELYSGPALTQFGAQRSTRGMFVETRWSF